MAKGNQLARHSISWLDRMYGNIWKNINHHAQKAGLKAKKVRHRIEQRYINIGKHSPFCNRAFNKPKSNHNHQMTNDINIQRGIDIANGWNKDEN